MLIKNDHTIPFPIHQENEGKDQLHQTSLLLLAENHIYIPQKYSFFIVLCPRLYAPMTNIHVTITVSTYSILYIDVHTQVLI